MVDDRHHRQTPRLQATTDGETSVSIEYCGEWYRIKNDQPFVIGRDGDLDVDDNPYLHRRFLTLSFDRMWWVSNVGKNLSATVSGGDGAVHAWLAPGGAMPLVFATTEVRFTAGPTAYAFTVHLEEPRMAVAGHVNRVHGSTTITPAELTLNQRLLVLSLAERSLRQPGTGSTNLPSSKDAARRLGWPSTKFNRQLDTVCQKLARAGVAGLHGGADSLARGRRARLVEYALAVRLVTSDDLPLIDLEAAKSAGEAD